MPDSYGICFTAVVFFGPSNAVAIIPPAVITATRRKRKIGVYSMPMTNVRRSRRRTLCEVFHKVVPKKTQRKTPGERTGRQDSLIPGDNAREWRAEAPEFPSRCPPKRRGIARL